MISGENFLHEIESFCCYTKIQFILALHAHILPFLFSPSAQILTLVHKKKKFNQPSFLVRIAMAETNCKHRKLETVLDDQGSLPLFSFFLPRKTQRRKQCVILSTSFYFHEFDLGEEK